MGPAHTQEEGITRRYKYQDVGGGGREYEKMPTTAMSKHRTPWNKRKFYFQTWSSQVIWSYIYQRKKIDNISVNSVLTWVTAFQYLDIWNVGFHWDAHPGPINIRTSLFMCICPGYHLWQARPCWSSPVCWPFCPSHSRAQCSLCGKQTVKFTRHLLAAAQLQRWPFPRCCHEAVGLILKAQQLGFLLSEKGSHMAQEGRKKNKSPYTSKIKLTPSSGVKALPLHKNMIIQILFFYFYYKNNEDGLYILKR